MIRLFKRILTAFMLSFLTIAIGINVYAEQNKYEYVVLGDSISTGVGLKDKEKQIFSNKLAKSIDKRSINLAINGIDSSDLVDIFRSNEKDINKYIRSSEVITLSIGGNNLLQPLMYSIKEALGLSENASSYEIERAVRLNPEPLVDLLTPEGLRSPEVTGKLKDGLREFDRDFPIIIKHIKDQNPEVKLVVQTLYNPFTETAILKPMSSVADIYISQINRSIKRNSYENNYLVADVYNVFKSNSRDVMTNMAYFDIHPNEKGQNEIYKTILSVVDDNIPQEIPTISSDKENGFGEISKYWKIICREIVEFFS
ncbi:SGNH/GDSL hydrolase family protein [Metaclostridioides mangenotii]|uniref:SGNH/GDSL hydrolase family protein n=1 Tax=Metaclostridioides mangenotii TaxID=1540 RepID=UPI0028E33A8C|nr:GDSL-type esterase/lipase family protein [Clostridioides mangenotii]